MAALLLVAASPLLSAAPDWGGTWIGYNPHCERHTPGHGAESRLNWEHTDWLWTGETDGNKNAPAGTFHFRWSVDLAKSGLVRQAWLRMASDDVCELYLNGHKISQTIDTARPVEREFAEFLRPGCNVFAASVENRSLSPAGWALKVVLEGTGGSLQELTPQPSDTLWAPATGVAREWAEPAFDTRSWKPAVSIGPVGIAPWGFPKAGFQPGSNQSAPAPILRRGFVLKKAPKRATLYSSGLGCHEVYCNGRKVGDAVLDPAMTQYDKTVLYSVNDVTGMLKAGHNALGVMLGHGWYAQTANTTWKFDQAAWSDKPKLLLKLKVDYGDGQSETIVSDSSWKAATGPVLADDFMNGEVYDAQQERPGWTTAEFNDATWAPAETMAAPAGALRPQSIAPMRVTQTIPPVKMWESRPGVFLFDLGQNIAGWARIRVQGPAGQQIRLRFGERLRDGQIDRKMGGLIWSGWFQEDRYTLKGGGMEQWEPRFTYHGFQYIEVDGWPGTPRLSDVDGRVVHTDFRAAGSFETSEPLINAIQHNTLWSYRSNFHGFPTDCPTREKKGWTGDAHLACEQAMFNWDNTAGYAKWMKDFEDIQDSQGRLRVTIPSPGWGGEALDWNVAAVLIPWTVYVFTGDRALIESSYPMMKRWLDFHAKNAPDFIVKDGVSDWCPAKTITPKEITSTCLFHGAATRMAKMAAILGKSDDEIAYKKLAESIKEAFNARFVKPDGTVGSGSQSPQACALYYELIPDALRGAAAKKLSDAVKAADEHVDVGILGAKALFRTLSEFGYHEQALKMVRQKTAPGYGCMVEQGFSTLTENWVGGGSANHIMFGDISAWFYEYLAGIQPDPEHPGFQHFLLRPQPAGDLKWVKAEHRSPYGLIRSNWKRGDDDAFTAQFAVPHGTTATVILPDGRREDVGAGDHTYTWKPNAR